MLIVGCLGGLGLFIDVGIFRCGGLGVVWLVMVLVFGGLGWFGWFFGVGVCFFGGFGEFFGLVFLRVTVSF